MSKSVFILFVIIIDNFNLFRSLAVKGAARSLSIAKFHIGINTFYELPLGFILGPIDFLPLHGSEKGLSNSVIMKAV